MNPCILYWQREASCGALGHTQEASSNCKVSFFFPRREFFFSFSHTVWMTEEAAASLVPEAANCGLARVRRMALWRCRSTLIPNTKVTPVALLLFGYFIAVFGFLI